LLTNNKVDFYCPNDGCEGKVKIFLKHIPESNIRIKVVMITHAHHKECQNKMHMSRLHIGQVRDLYHRLLVRGQILPMTMEADGRQGGGFTGAEQRFKYLQEYVSAVSNGKEEVGKDDPRPQPNKKKDKLSAEEIKEKLEKD